jgi:hypothetical protein
MSFLKLTRNGIKGRLPELLEFSKDHANELELFRLCIDKKTKQIHPTSINEINVNSDLHVLCNLSNLSPDICPLHSKNIVFLNSMSRNLTVNLFAECILSDIIMHGNTKCVLEIRLEK